jgi:hypothetical protein
VKASHHKLALYIPFLNRCHGGGSENVDLEIHMSILENIDLAVTFSKNGSKWGLASWACLSGAAPIAFQTHVGLLSFNPKATSNFIQAM